MKKRYLALVLLFVIGGILLAAVFDARLPPRSKSFASQGQQKPKSLRERAREHDVEVEGPSDSDLVDITLAGLKTESHAIVYGRVLNSRSFFDESPFAVESGDSVTTEYEFEIVKVLKDTTREVIPAPPKPAPALLITPLTIARNGGVVAVNGHRASVKVKGFDVIESGRSYVMFLNWSPDYHAYVPTAGIFGVVAVGDDGSVRSLSSANSLQKELNKMTLEAFLNELER